MSFFKNSHKKLAKKNSQSYLINAYEKSEQELINIARTGNERALKNAMKEHGEYEYALLYKQTPQFRKKTNKRG